MNLKLNILHLSSIDVLSKKRKEKKNEEIKVVNFINGIIVSKLLNPLAKSKLISIAQDPRIFMFSNLLRSPIDGFPKALK